MYALYVAELAVAGRALSDLTPSQWYCVLVELLLMLSLNLWLVRCAAERGMNLLPPDFTRGIKRRWQANSREARAERNAHPPARRSCWDTLTWSLSEGEGFYYPVHLLVMLLWAAIAMGYVQVGMTSRDFSFRFLGILRFHRARAPCGGLLL